MRHRASFRPAEFCQASPDAVHAFHEAEIGDHDENISFERAVEIVGEKAATDIRDLSLKVYETAAEHARKQGIIIADTKFEFGVLERLHDSR